MLTLEVLIAGRWVDVGSFFGVHPYVAASRAGYQQYSVRAVDGTGLAVWEYHPCRA